MKVIATIVPAALALMPATAMAASISCESLSSLSKPDAKVDLAQSVPAGDYGFDVKRPGTHPQNLKNMPAFCRVAMTLKPSSDSDIKVEVWLPANWNGKLVAYGNGNWAGAISYAAMAGGLRAGYAVTSTDTGHAAVSTDGKWSFGHPEKVTDFGWRSEHEMTVKAKAVVDSFYGNGPRLSYWSGCSTGGRQGIMEATRFPDDFDGIVAGAISNPRAGRNTWQISVTASIHKNPGAMIPADKFSTIHQAVLTACDALDGVKDGLLENPKACHFDPQVLLCKGADNASCLSAAQIQSVKTLLSPGKLANGDIYHPGLELGSELGWDGYTAADSYPGDADENFKYLVYKDPNWDWHTINADTALPLAKIGDAGTDVTTADMSKFMQHKGKLIFYHGWADPRVAPQGTVNYYSAVQKATPGAGNSLRMFMVPGMGHCDGGEGATDHFDMVAALNQWVDKGQVPQQVLATHVDNGKVTRSRPPCPYPQQAHYKGAGSIDEAANFECKAP